MAERRGTFTRPDERLQGTFQWIAARRGTFNWNGGKAGHFMLEGPKGGALLLDRIRGCRTPVSRYGELVTEPEIPLLQGVVHRRVHTGQVVLSTVVPLAEM